MDGSGTHNMCGWASFCFLLQQRERFIIVIQKLPSSFSPEQLHTEEEINIHRGTIWQVMTLVFFYSQHQTGGREESIRAHVANSSCTNIYENLNDE